MPKQVSKYFLSLKFLILISFLSFNFSNFSQTAQHPAPVVNYSLAEFCYGDTAYFTNTTPNATSYIWNVYLQDVKYDTVSYLMYTTANVNLKYLFPFPGKYYVELFANNGHLVSLKHTLRVDSVATASFGYQDCMSRFINLSVCYSSCIWNFGDGHSSTEISPVHYYDSTGKYKVMLTAVSGNKTNTLSDSVIVTRVNDMSGDFTYKVYKDSVFFHASDSTTGHMNQYLWAFGDGTVSDLNGLTGGQKLYHKYSKKDTAYLVYLLVRSSCLTSYSSQKIFVPDSTPVNGTYFYPNPVAGSLIHIESEMKKNISKIILVNCFGQESCNFIVSETTKGYNINLGDLPKGLYFMDIFFGKEIKKFKVLKE
jgi:PKD repeat protein